MLQRRRVHERGGGVRPLLVPQLRPRVHLGVLAGQLQLVQPVDEDVRVGAAAAVVAAAALGALVQHLGHGVVVVVGGGLVAVAVVAVGLGRGAPVGVEPQVLAVGEVHVGNVVHFMYRNYKNK